MNAKRLSKRLEVVASYVPSGAILADIGSDHAYLPCYLIHKGVAKKAIAGEVVKGPYQSACQQVKEEQLEAEITVRLADGLAAIEKEDQVDTITIAGMGGPLIVSILEKHPSSLQGVSRLILQPNIHAKAIRDWAEQNDWNIIAEEILEEDDKIYEVLVLERGTNQLSELEKLLGPFLMIEKSPVFIQKWRKEMEQWQVVLQALTKAEPSEKTTQKEQELTTLIDHVGKVILS